MMSIVFSRNKEKRPRSSSSDANNSFVKNVTSRVSSLLPTTITKWFSSPSSSNTNGSAPAADNTDSSTEDEAPESPVTAQPPAKRMRFSSPGKYNNFTLTDSTSALRTTETKDPPLTPYNAVQSPPGRNSFTRDTNFVSTPLRSPDEESATEASEKEITVAKTQHTVSAIGQSLASKRKSLFLSSSKSESTKSPKLSSTLGDPKKPCFKPTLLGSPFYSGRTMYGGASSSTYINQPNIKQRKMALVKESNANDTAAMSQSARRIMDLLENYSSPLSEARRIPHLVRSPKNDSLNASIDSIAPHGNKVLSYKTQELHVPSIASILRLKQRSRLMDTTNAARQIIASHSSSDYSPYPKSSSTYNTEKEHSEIDSGSILTTKVKSRLTRAKRGGDSNIDEVSPPVQLPTGVLQIEQGNLPKFSFSGSSTSKTITSTSYFSMVTSVSTVTSAPKMSVSESGTRSQLEPTISKPDDASSNMFKFSSPVRVLSEPAANSTPPKFVFGSPERGVDKPVVGDKKDDTAVVVSALKSTEKTVDTPKEWKCPECWISNKTDEEKCICCGYKKISTSGDKPAKCTVCKLANSQSQSDKCVNCDKIKANNAGAASVAKPSDASKWKCEDCWVSNDLSVEKCLCCGNANPKKTSNIAKVQTGTNSIGSDWKCDDCWIANKSSVEKCAACGGAKPGSKSSVPVSTPTTFVPVKPADNILSNIVKSQKVDKWECSSCLVRNDKDKAICACCGAERLSEKSAAMKTFNFGMNTGTSFKFGIDHKAQEASLTKKNEEAAPIAKPLAEESETNNNVLAKTPTFTFTLRPRKPDEVNDSTNQKTDEPPKMNFNFGISKMAPATPVVINKPAETAKVTEEKPQEVPKINFALPAQETQKPLTGLFTIVQPEVSKPTGAIPSMISSPFAAEKKEIAAVNQPTLQLTQAIVTSVETSKPQTTFTFSPSGMGGSSNLFGSPAPKTTATVISFGSPSQTTMAPTTASAMTMFQKPETTTTSISLFPKSDPKTTSTVSLFQKFDANNTTAPPSVAATAPIFGFGSNTSNATSQQDKSKFTFTFGSGNSSTTENNMFKSFGTLVDSNAASKPFTISTGSALSRVNTGTLGGTNGPRAGAPIPSNPLRTATELSTNTLTRGSSLQMGNMSSGMFGQPAQKDNNNMWSSNNNNNNNNNAAPNMFASSTSTNTQKPASFSFGSGSGLAFNTTNATPAFGNTSQPAQNVFGMSSQGSGNQPPMFSTPTQSQPPPSIFGNATPAPNPTPSMGMFGTPNVGATPSFGTPNPSIPSFEAPSLTPAPAPAFNFGAPQTSAVFGFGQQQQQQQPQQQQQQQQQTGVYNFGGAAGANSQVQFNMGSAPGMRRVRKAVRRNQR